MLRILASVLMTLSFTVQAAPLKLFTSAQCPAVGEEYGKLISKLDAIKASIKDGANCGQVVLKVKSLEQLLSNDRQKILEILDKGQAEPLDADQAKFVKDYAEDLTTKVASLFDLFSGSNQCFDADKSNDGLTTLAGFVNEASRLVSSLSGPWATPITLAGNVVAGFLTGLDQVMKTRAGYDFSKPENWKNYVQNVCTFYSYRDQVDHLLNPEGRLSQLQDLKNKLDAQMNLLADRCEECRGFEKSLFSVKGVSRTDVERADHRFTAPLGTYTLYVVGIRNWVNNEIKRVQKESASYWADVSGRHLLSQARTDLEQFLFQREGPRFLQYQVRKSVQDFEDFQGYVFQEGRNLYSRFYYAHRDAVPAKLSYYWPDPIAMFQALVTSPIRWELVPQPKADDLRFVQKSFRDRSVASLRTAESSLQVVDGFCAFFRQAGYYTSAVSQACKGDTAARLGEKMNKLEESLAAAGMKMPMGMANPTDNSGRTQLDSLDLFIKQLQP